VNRSVVFFLFCVTYWNARHFILRPSFSAPYYSSRRLALCPVYVAEQASGNIQTVAATSEELSASIQEFAGHTKASIIAIISIYKIRTRKMAERAFDRRLEVETAELNRNK